jgi:hypothetical protein
MRMKSRLRLAAARFSSQGVPASESQRFATALTEGMCEKHFQFCIFDPEGDYQELEHAVVIGDAKTPPTQDAVFGVLEKPTNNVVVNTLALAMQERPTFFAQLLPRISAMRSRLARPHWLIIDEAHHLLPADRSDVTVALPGALTGTIFVTVHPRRGFTDGAAIGRYRYRARRSCTGCDHPLLPGDWDRDACSAGAAC